MKTILITILIIICLIAGIYILQIILFLFHLITHKGTFVTGIKEVEKHIINFINSEISNLSIIALNIEMDVELYFNKRHRQINEDEIYTKISVKNLPEGLKKALIEVGIIEESKFFKSVNLQFRLPKKVENCLKLARDFFIDTIVLDEDEQDFVCVIPRRRYIKGGSTEKKLY